MRKIKVIMSKRKKIVAIILVAVLGLCVYIFRTTHIREIPDIEDWVADPYNGTVIVKCFIIANPPKEFSALRDLAEQHLDEHLDEIVSPGDVQTMYKCFFYRASRRMPWWWKENSSPWKYDYIDQHTDDMIIAVYWTTEDSIREYHVMKKSNSKDDYGATLEKVYYKGSSMIEE